MANTKLINISWSETGVTVYCIIRREADLYRLNDADGTFALNPADPYLPLTEDSTIKGLYEKSESRVVWNDGDYYFVFYKQAGGSPAPVSDTVIGYGTMEIISDSEPAGDDAIVLSLIKTETDKIPTTIVKIDDIKTETLTHPTLSEIEASSILAKEATLANATYGLSALKILIDAIDNSTELIAKFTEIKGAGWVDENLTALNVAINSIKTKTDNLPVDPASDSNINQNETKIDSIVTITGLIKTETDKTPATIVKIDAVKVKTDTITWENITDIHDESFGKWILDPTAKTLTLYRIDGVTVLKTFDLTSTTSIVPDFVRRTPQ